MNLVKEATTKGKISSALKKLFERNQNCDFGHKLPPLKTPVACVLVHTVAKTTSPSTIKAATHSTSLISGGYKASVTVPRTIKRAVCYL